MDATQFDRFQAGISAAETPGDFERLSAELRAHAAANPDDPDVPALGEQIAMTRRAVVRAPSRA